MTPDGHTCGIFFFRDLQDLEDHQVILVEMAYQDEMELVNEDLWGPQALRVKVMVKWAHLDPQDHLGDLHQEEVELVL